MTPRMRGWAWGGAACALVVASGCTFFRARQPPPIVNGVQVGIASWYGPGFQGNRTANGEIYDQFELTAAHPSLPLGTRAMVTNLANGRAVEVRINDRGPFVDGRAIDLSYAAARTIGLVGLGTGRVRIEMLRNAPAPSLRTAPAPPPAQEVPTSSYTIEVAALADPVKADHLRSVLASRFPDAFVVPVAGTTGRYYRVRIGPYPLRGVAVARAELVNRLGYPAILLENPEP